MKVYGGPEGYINFTEVDDALDVAVSHAKALKNDSADRKSAIEFVHPKLIEGVGNALRAGELKYAAWNFVKGHGRLQLCAAMMRHLLKMMAGEDVDEDCTARLGRTVYHWDCLLACVNMFIYQRELGTLIEDSPQEYTHYTKRT
jgi:hypothetical protein